MCSDDENQFQTRLAHVRTCFQHYFENFEEKAEIVHFWLSMFKTDFHHLNTSSDVFLVGQSLVISSVFYVFPHYYTLL